MAQCLTLLHKSSPAALAPRCELEPTVADAGMVLYATERVVRLRLCNTGQVRLRVRVAHALLLRRAGT